MSNKVDRSDFYGRTMLMAGNWKMYKTIKEAKDFAKEFKKNYSGREDVKAAICAKVPAILKSLVVVWSIQMS